MKTLQITCAATALFIIAYWTSVFLGIFPVLELVPGFKNWFMAFPIADLWIAIFCLLTVFFGIKKDNRAAPSAIAAGSALVFLGINAFTYGIISGVLFIQSIDEYIEIAIKIFCLSFGGYLVYWGFKSFQKPNFLEAKS